MRCIQKEVTFNHRNVADYSELSARSDGIPNVEIVHSGSSSSRVSLKIKNETKQLEANVPYMIPIVARTQYANRLPQIAAAKLMQENAWSIVNRQTTAKPLAARELLIKALTSGTDKVALMLTSHS